MYIGEGEGGSGTHMTNFHGNNPCSFYMHHKYLSDQEIYFLTILKIFI